jgi:DtxR family Mn-dependent transcriptional regulator
MLSQSMENYLKAIYEIQERADKATTSSIAARMNIASPSVTAMVKKLAELRLVSHEPYQGAMLTEAGRKAALEVVRHHRLLELYLNEALGVPWDRVHDEAERLEHVISEDIEDRMSDALGNPTVDPHGAPIPTRDGSVKRVEAQMLAMVPAGETVTVVEVEDRDPELLRYLGELELYPGTEIKVLKIEPFDGPFYIRRKDKEFVLGRAAAREILVSM